MEFEQAWLLGDEPARTAVRAEVASYRGVDPAALEFTSGPRFVRWSHLLRGDRVPRAPSRLETWVAEWNLAIEPGWMEAAPGCTESSLTVHVEAPGRPTDWPSDQPNLQVELYWRQPGAEPVRARKESVHVSNFDRRGFDLFVAPPAEQPGNWWLEPRLVVAERELPGFAVPFAIRPGGSTRVLEDLGAPAGWIDAYRGFRTRGVRDLRLGTWENLLEPAAPAWRSGTWEGWSFAVLDANPGVPQRARIWLAVPGGDLPQGEFMGPRGAAWAQLAGQGIQIVAHSAPLYTLQGSNAWDAMGLATPGQDPVPTLLVVRGPQVRDLILAQAQEPRVGLQALVLLQALPERSRPASPCSGTRTLFLLASEARTDGDLAPEGALSQRVLASIDPYAWLDATLATTVAANLEWLLDSEPGPSKR
ncbi:MAG: hypothetical protein H6829_01035 [Planctomycetes bacterium]|nr:hypothetical protein [Planctomycetota bacterium]